MLKIYRKKNYIWKRIKRKLNALHSHAPTRIESRYIASCTVALRCRCATNSFFTFTLHICDALHCSVFWRMYAFDAWLYKYIFGSSLCVIEMCMVFVLNSLFIGLSEWLSRSISLAHSPLLFGYFWTFFTKWQPRH